MELKQRAIHSVFWVFIFSITALSARFITTLILAKVFDANIFGIIALCILFLDVLSLFRDAGFSKALIQRQNDVEKATNTAVIVMPLIGLILFAIGYVAAPFAAHFFRNVAVTSAFRVLALNLVITSFGMVPSALLERELLFRKKVFAEVFPIFLYGIIAILLAYNGFGVWSIVIASIAQQTLQTMLLWYASGWKPHLEFNWKLAKELFRFGKFVMGSGLTIFLFHNVDYMVIGRLLSTRALGIYMFSYKLANFSAANITRIVGQVLFPTYSKIQNDLERIRNGYFRVALWVSLIAFPICFGLIFFGGSFLTALYGNKWIEAIPVVQVLAVYGLCRCFGMTTGSVFMALGQPKWLMYVSIFQLIVMVALIYPAIKLYGILGVAWAGAIAMTLGVILVVAKTARMLKISMLTYLKTISYGAILSLGVVILVYFLLDQISQHTGVLLFFEQMTSCCVLYGILLYSFDKYRIFDEVRSLVKLRGLGQ
jgi:O-antigen/teichoic acid export membrane protein